MDRHSSSARNATLAAVVRQFTPARIENQLLAQVFQLIVTAHSNDQPTTLTAMNDVQLDEIPSAPSSAPSPVAARSAA